MAAPAKNNVDRQRADSPVEGTVTNFVQETGLYPPERTRRLYPPVEGTVTNSSVPERESNLKETGFHPPEKGKAQVGRLDPDGRWIWRE